MTTEMRFFLASLLLDFSEQGEFALPSKTLSSQYGVSLNTVNKTLKYLVMSGYANRMDVSLKRGRPIGRYVFTEALNAKLNEPSDWIDSIRPVEFWEQLAIKFIGRGGHGKYTISNRYLICLLAMFANEVGVVEAIPSSRVAKILGFTSLRLRSQLNSLIAHQVLISHTGGVTGKHLFGKVPGIYFLNIESVAEILNIPLEELSFRKMNRGVISEGQDRYQIMRLYRLARLLLEIEFDSDGKSLAVEEAYQKKWWAYEQDSFKKVCLFFRDHDQTRVPDYLQTKLEQYIASYLSIASLSEQSKKRKEADYLKPKIATDCLPAKFRQDETIRETFSLFVDEIFSIVEGVANKYSDYFELKELLDVRFRISAYEEGFTIEAF
ncbi:hypothetical protein [Vibrio owensii]|uniref:hypothetical protein n=1 Tax=Vibrio owensii TaxID=696485 RepID=UPI0022DDCBEA|nr:hypothetical protein [Vibrio owensii]MDA0383555.1 hypothetical protein [Vibrio owensii]